MMPWGTLGSKTTEETSLIIAFQKNQVRSLAHSLCLMHTDTHTILFCLRYSFVP